MKNRLPRILALILTVMLASNFFTACGGGECKVIFDLNTQIVGVDESDSSVTGAPSPTTVKSGSPVAEPDAPVWAGYDFGGWYTDADCAGDKYDFSASVTAATLRLYAKWSKTVISHTVTFDYNYSGDSDTAVSVADGQSVSAPAAPVRNGYIFGGWYLDAACVTAYNFAARVTSALTLFAKWSEAYSGTFNYNYPDSPAPVVVKTARGAALARPSNPVRANYAFAGWFTDSATTQSFDFAPRNADITLYAKWIAATDVTYNVTFDYNYDGEPAPIVQQVAENAVVNPIADPARAGKLFDGWFTAEEGGTRFNLSTPVTAAITLYARWVDSYAFTVNYNYEGASPPVVAQKQLNDSVPEPAAPSRTGYVFAGWSNAAAGLVGSVVFPLVISADVTVYAQWTKTFIFEAEDVDFTGFVGSGFSGGMTGTGAIIYGEKALTAVPSNGRFVSYMNTSASKITFEFTSDRAISGAALAWRLSAEVADITITPTGDPATEGVFTVKVNGTAINYDPISFTGVPGQSLNYYKPFADFALGNIDIQAGTNTVELATANSRLVGGTMTSTAPMVDCLKLTTYAGLTFTPKPGNY